VAAAAVAGAILSAYVAIQQPSTGHWGLTRAGQWNLYGAVAPFADCSKFDPPAGTEALCDARPRSQRPGTEQFIFDRASSPAVQAFGTPFDASQESNAKVAAFARAVIVGQPLDYAASVARGMLRYVAPERGAEFGHGPSYEFFVRQELFNGQRMEEARQWSLPYYGADASGYFGNQARLDFLFGYERATRVQGALIVLLALLMLAGPLLGRPRVRATAMLFSALAIVSLVVPVATHFFDARTSVPAFGLLGCAAATGAWALVQRAAGWRAAASAQPPPAAPSPEPV